MSWRQSSRRSSYPLAGNSRNRRRLMLLHGVGSTEWNETVDNVAAEDAAREDVPAEEITEFLDDSAVSALDAYYAGDPSAAIAGEDVDDDGGVEAAAAALAAVRLVDTFDDESADVAESGEELDVENADVDVAAFVDEAFEAAEDRNARQQQHGVSDSVLDDDEDTWHSPADSHVAADAEDSMISAMMGEESQIFTPRAEESRVLTLADLEHLSNDALPGGQARPLDQPTFPGWYVPTFRSIERLLKGEQPVTWVFAGDSMTAADDRLTARHNFTEQFGERVRWELDRQLDVVVNSGIEATTVADVFKHLDARVLRFRPDVVTLLVGLSDSRAGGAGRETFARTLKKTVRAIRDTGAAVVLQTPQRILLEQLPEYQDVRAYVRTIRDIARDLTLPCVDHWDHWKQTKPKPAERAAWLTEGGVQPGVTGHQEMARLIFRRFEIYDANSPACTGDK